MQRTVRYLDRDKNERTYTFDQDIEKLDLVGENSGEGYSIIGFKQDKENDTLKGVFDVLNEEELNIEVPRVDDGTSVAFYYLNQ